jgi:glycosyltransferase involved in cell wall biosynthesis
MKIAVIIPAYNSSKLLADTLTALHSGTRVPDELIVVDDASTDDSALVAERCGAQVVVMPHNVGPAACRNQAALLAQSEVLVFIDSDTCMHPQALERMAEHLIADPDLTAVFGSYDDTPRDPGMCSQYRNLAHCYVHRSANRTALTFWSGCGAVRRDALIAVDGFDERYRRPSTEDIEFGYRMSNHGARILLDPEICVTHTKRWTVWNSIVTDVMDRGIPWMVLLLERGNVPNDLNIKRRHRIAALFTALAILCLAAGLVSVKWLILSAILAILALCMDVGLLSFIYRKRGLRLLAVAALMILVQNVCKLAAAGGGLLIFIYRLMPSSRLHRGERRSRIQTYRQLRGEESVSVSAPSSFP